MKKIANLLLGAVLFALLAVSCDVEKFPYDRIEQTQAFNTVADATALANGMYAQLRNRIHGDYMYTSDVQSDLFNAGREFGNRNGSPHRWEDFMATDYNLRDIWRGYYSALVNVNNIIDNIHRVQTKNEAEVATIERILGEAYLIRAFYYHQLVIRWGKPFNPATAATDLGVPLVLTYSPAARPARSSVLQVYNQILADISQAESRLPAATTHGAIRITRDAALALKSRVNLHMRNYAVAAQASSELIATARYSLTTSMGQLINMWYQDSGNEVIFRLDASLTELPAGESMGLYLGWVSARQRYRPDFVPQQWVVDLFENTDFRKNVYLSSLPVLMTNVEYDGIYLLNKFPGNPALRSGNVTNYRHKPIVFRIAEVHLNLAEALYRDNKPAEALAALNVLRVARGLNALNGISGEELFQEIRNERTRELIGEGFRLNDLMRWEMGVQRSAPQNANIVLTGEVYDQLSIPAGHPKFVWGIPQNDITTNPNLVQNPGW
jgi:starch-binding outer membrane protein, SusD/RagB family